MAKTGYDIFISYRREGGKDYARTLKPELEKRGFKVFLDFDELKDGVFDKRIMDAISESPIFLVILSQGALDRCINEEDRVRQEILFANESNRHIVPVEVDETFRGFPNNIPDEIKSVLGCLQFSQIYTETLFQESIDKLVKNRILPHIHHDEEETGAEIHLDTDAGCDMFQIFISYSRHDKTLVFPLVELINQELGTQCWIDLKGIESGEEFEEVIMNAIEKCKVVLFMLSDNSLKSRWTKREVYYAEGEGKRIIPILIDGNNLRGWFKFHFGNVDFINIQSNDHKEKLISNLKSWLGVKTEPISSSINTIDQHRFDSPQINTDVFISFSRKDQQIANALYEALTAKGLNVWYDKKDITHGNSFMDFQEEIQNAIESTRIFIPIISSNLKEERKYPHVYRLEWKLAETHSMKLARDFIYPLVEEDFDFYNAEYVDRRIREIDATIFKPDQKNFEEIASFFVRQNELINEYYLE